MFLFPTFPTGAANSLSSLAERSRLTSGSKSTAVACSSRCGSPSGVGVVNGVVLGLAGRTGKLIFARVGDEAEGSGGNRLVRAAAGAGLAVAVACRSGGSESGSETVSGLIAFDVEPLHLRQTVVTVITSQVQAFVPKQACLTPAVLGLR